VSTPAPVPTAVQDTPPSDRHAEPPDRHHSRITKARRRRAEIPSTMAERITLASGLRRRVATVALARGRG